MAVSNAPNRRSPHRRLPLSEKRRIVELALREGASVRAIAREHGVNRNSLYQWQALYRAGKLGEQPAQRGVATSTTTFLPVMLAPEVRMPTSLDRNVNVVQLMLASGATLRIETGALDAELICALVAQLQR